MKEDVLEEVVDDYLKFLGYFTRHNVSFKPSLTHPDYVANQDRVPSDVDVIGVHPKKRGVDRVIVVSCKSWQSGFDADRTLQLLKTGGRIGKREAWRSFREVWVPKWSEALIDTVDELVGTRRFAYRIAITHLKGTGTAWAADPTIAANLVGCSFDFLPLSTIWAKLLDELTTRPASSEVGRLIQILKAAGLTAPHTVAEPIGPAPGSDAAVVEQAERDTF
jgi:hypothetical protein